MVLFSVAYFIVDKYLIYMFIILIDSIHQIKTKNQEGTKKNQF
jgi:hypothetical protein